MTSLRSTIVLVGFATCLALSAVAQAGERSKPKPSAALPGVDSTQGERARLEHKADAPTADQDENGFVHVGDWRVKISGSVTIDIGTFAPPQNRD